MAGRLANHKSQVANSRCRPCLTSLAHARFLLLVRAGHQRSGGRKDVLSGALRLGCRGRADGPRRDLHAADDRRRRGRRPLHAAQGTARAPHAAPLAALYRRRQRRRCGREGGGRRRRRAGPGLRRAGLRPHGGHPGPGRRDLRRVAGRDARRHDRRRRAVHGLLGGPRHAGRPEGGEVLRPSLRLEGDGRQEQADARPRTTTGTSPPAPISSAACRPRACATRTRRRTG